MDVIARWHDYVKAGDPALLDALLAEEAEFISPARHVVLQGKAEAGKYLRAAMVVLNGRAFRYLNEWRGDRSAILEFEAEVDGLIVNGVDMIWWDESGKITRFKVMIRPLRALNAVVARMAAELNLAPSRAG